MIDEPGGDGADDLAWPHRPAHHAGADEDEDGEEDGEPGEIGIFQPERFVTRRRGRPGQAREKQEEA